MDVYKKFTENFIRADDEEEVGFFIFNFFSKKKKVAHTCCWIA